MTHPLSVIRRAPPPNVALINPLSSMNFTTRVGGMLRPSSSEPTRKYSTSESSRYDEAASKHRGGGGYGVDKSP